MTDFVERRNRYQSMVDRLDTDQKYRLLEKLTELSLLLAEAGQRAEALGRSQGGRYLPVTFGQQMATLELELTCALETLTSWLDD